VTLLSRRSLGLLAAAALAPAAQAALPLQGGNAPGFHRFRLGAFEVTVISDGWANLGPPHPTFGANAPAAEVQGALAAARLPADRVIADFSCTVVNTGAQLILFDTGSGPGRPFGPETGRLPDSLRAAGIPPEAVDLVAFTHAHPDHAWGTLRADGSPAFPNARYAIGAADFDFWTAAERASAPDPIGAFVRGTRAALLPFAPRTTMLAPGQDVAPGIRAIASPGHTPGHLCFLVESGGEALLIAGDIANHHVLSLARPDWGFAFDADPAQASQTRARVLGMAAADRLAVIAYHFPWPGVGHVEAAGQGFRWAPIPWRWG
jgi:glyoxylase-like metal-dependent hydrolase (beta-lactamase superfamily II)